MKVNYTRIIEILFPPSEDVLTVRNANHNLFYLPPINQKNNPVSILPYANPVVRASIHLAKFHFDTLSKQLLAHALLAYVTHLSTPPIIIPIPLSRQRQRERGYNQVTEIIKVAKKLAPKDIHYNDKILIRTRHTAPQTSLNRNDRLTNVANAFTVHATASLPSPDIPLLLLDDVTTTGTTLQCAQAVLQSALPNPITCAALAH